MHERAYITYTYDIIDVIVNTLIGAHILFSFLSHVHSLLRFSSSFLPFFKFYQMKRFVRQYDISFKRNRAYQHSKNMIAALDCINAMNRQV